MENEIKFIRHPAGKEDLLLGSGKVKQTRNGVEVEISKIDADTVPYDDKKSIKQHLDSKHIDGGIHVQDGTITGIKVADGSITNSKIADGAVSSSKLDKNLTDLNNRHKTRIDKIDDVHIEDLTGTKKFSSLYNGSANNRDKRLVTEGKAEQIAINEISTRKPAYYKDLTKLAEKDIYNAIDKEGLYLLKFTGKSATQNFLVIINEIVPNQKRGSFVDETGMLHQLIIKNTGEINAPPIQVDTPQKDLDIANKKYVDDIIASGGGDSVYYKDLTRLSGQDRFNAIAKEGVYLLQDDNVDKGNPYLVLINLVNPNEKSGIFINSLQMLKRVTITRNFMSEHSPSVVKPSYDSQIANKKYVDDKVAAGGGGAGGVSKQYVDDADTTLKTDYSNKIEVIDKSLDLTDYIHSDFTLLGLTNKKINDEYQATGPALTGEYSVFTIILTELHKKFLQDPSVFVTWKGAERFIIAGNVHTGNELFTTFFKAILEKDGGDFKAKDTLVGPVLFAIRKYDNHYILYIEYVCGEEKKHCGFVERFNFGDDEDDPIGTGQYRKRVTHKIEPDGDYEEFFDIKAETKRKAVAPEIYSLTKENTLQKGLSLDHLSKHAQEELNYNPNIWQNKTLLLAEYKGRQKWDILQYNNEVIAPNAILHNKQSREERIIIRLKTGVTLKGGWYNLIGRWLANSTDNVRFRFQYCKSRGKQRREYDDDTRVQDLNNSSDFAHLMRDVDLAYSIRTKFRIFYNGSEADVIGSAHRFAKDFTSPDQKYYRFTSDVYIQSVHANKDLFSSYIYFSLYNETANRAFNLQPKCFLKFELDTGQSYHI